MNGRVYDYDLGRFLSVDPIIQFPANSQSLNPYSYIMNNPLSGTDPTGYAGRSLCGAGSAGSNCFVQDFSKGSQFLGHSAAGRNGEGTMATGKSPWIVQGGQSGGGISGIGSQSQIGFDIFQAPTKQHTKEAIEAAEEARRQLKREFEEVDGNLLWEYAGAKSAHEFANAVYNGDKKAIGLAGLGVVIDQASRGFKLLKRFGGFVKGLFKRGASAPKPVALLPVPRQRTQLPTDGRSPNAPNTVAVDSRGNAIPLREGERLTGSPDGRYIQVRDSAGTPTGVRIDGPHKLPHTDPRSLQPHAHIPGRTNSDGTPWLPINQ